MGYAAEKNLKVLFGDLRIDLSSFFNLKKAQNGNQVLTRVIFYSTLTQTTKVVLILTPFTSVGDKSVALAEHRLFHCLF